MSRIITSIVSVLVGTLLVPAAMHTTPAHAAPAEPKPGDRISAGSPLFTLHTQTPERFDAARARLDEAAVILPDSPSAIRPIVLDRIG